MKPVTITYRPLSFLPIYRTVTGNFPQNWGDTTPAQLIAIACLYKNRIGDLAFLKAMSGLPLRVLKRTSDYERYKLMELLEYVGTRKPYHEFIVRKIHAKAWHPVLYAPEGKLKGISFAQFIFADTYFSNYQATQNEDDLNKFIVSLYLRKREQFSEAWIQRRHEAMRHLDKNIREAIVINYELMHEWLTLAYPLIFQKYDEQLVLGAEPNEQKTHAHDPNTWVKVFQNFVGDDILHDDVWASKPINTIFAYMTRKYKENARRKN